MSFLEGLGEALKAVGSAGQAGWGAYQEGKRYQDEQARQADERKRAEAYLTLMQQQFENTKENQQYQRLSDTADRYLSAASASGYGQELSPELMRQFPGLREQVTGAAQAKSRELDIINQQLENYQLDRSMSAEDAGLRREFQRLQNELMQKELNAPGTTPVTLSDEDYPIYREMMKDTKFLNEYIVNAERDPARAEAFLLAELRRRKAAKLQGMGAFVGPPVPPGFVTPTTTPTNNNTTGSSGYSLPLYAQPRTGQPGNDILGQWLGRVWDRVNRGPAAYK